MDPFEPISRELKAARERAGRNIEAATLLAADRQALARFRILRARAVHRWGMLVLGLGIGGLLAPPFDGVTWTFLLFAALAAAGSAMVLTTRGVAA